MSNTSNSDVLKLIRKLGRKDQQLVAKKMKAMIAKRKYKERKEDQRDG
jgi:hypothetical protein